MRNPAWTRDEIILGMDVYLRNIRTRPITATNEDVLFLSRLLNELPIHPMEKRGAEFRNPAGVDLQIRSFKTLDPKYILKSSLNYGRLFKIVWNDFIHQRDYLHRVAMAIVACQPLPFDYCHRLDLEEQSFFEGSILYQYHRYIETNVERLERLKKEVAGNGWLSCSVCGFDYEEAYGRIGEGYMEFHFFCPPVEYANSMEIHDEDFGPVCSNCHRMLHRHRPWLGKAERVLILK